LARRKTGNQKQSRKGLRQCIYIGIGVIFIAVIIFFFATRPPQYPLQEGKYGVYFDSGFSVTQEWKEVIYNALHDWDMKFGCETNIRVSKLVGKPEELREKNGDYMVAVAVAGRIGYNLPEVRGLDDLRLVTLHEATHACRIESTMLPEPLLFPDYAFGADKITGFTGFIVITNVDQVYPNNCDEMLAEYNARQFPGYVPPHPGYDALGKTLTQKFPNDKKITEMGKHNDFMGFIALYYGFPKEKVGGAEVEKMLKECDSIFNQGSKTK
jgi:hypothetical protein